MEYFTLEQQIKPFILLILIVSLLTLNIFYSKANESIGKKREVNAFKGMLISFMVYTLVDIRLIVGDSFYSLPRLFVLFVVSAGFGAMSFSSYFWFMHVFASLHMKSRPKNAFGIKLSRILILIPLAVDLILLFTPLHVFVYQVADGMISFYPGMMVLLIMDYIYLILAAAISIYNIRKAKTKHEKRKCIDQLFFIVCYTLSGILIGFLLNLPAIELCVMPVVLKLFVELQDSQIYTDALTKLYNRRRMNEFLSEEITHCSNEKPLTIIMIDMDYFKSINDMFGHDEGDKALIFFSAAIRKVFLTKNAVASRWGGDEFVIAGMDKSLLTNFREELENALTIDNDLGYIPPFSAGVYVCTTPSLGVEKAIACADADLYKDKEIQHQKTGDFIQKLSESKNIM